MTDEIKINKNVEMPSGRGGRKAKYPWRKMKKGDSFFTDAQFMGGVASGAAERLGNGCKFTTRRVTEKGKKGTRVWRVS